MNPLARMMLEGTVREGSVVSVDAQGEGRTGSLVLRPVLSGAATDTAVAAAASSA